MQLTLQNQDSIQCKSTLLQNPNTQENPYIPLIAAVYQKKENLTPPPIVASSILPLVLAVGRAPVNTWKSANEDANLASTGLLWYLFHVFVLYNINSLLYHNFYYNSKFIDCNLLLTTSSNFGKCFSGRKSLVIFHNSLP